MKTKKTKATTLKTDWISIGEASKILKKSPATLRRWGLAGKLNTYWSHDSTFRLYRKADVLKTKKIWT